jgi:hypothetical protein
MKDTATIVGNPVFYECLSSTQEAKSGTGTAPVQVKQGRLNFTRMVGVPEGAEVTTGTFSIHGKPVKILFDSSATHSFMNQSTQVNLGLNVLQVKNE